VEAVCAKLKLLDHFRTVHRSLRARELRAKEAGENVKCRRMRLTSAKVSGLGKLVDQKINLDQSLIAIIGPNESGKSTLIKALAFLDSEEEDIESFGLSFTENFDFEPGHEIIRLTYTFDNNDSKFFDGFDLAQSPQTFTIALEHGSEIFTSSLEPEPRRNTQAINEAIGSCFSSLTPQRLERYQGEYDPFADEEEYSPLSGEARDSEKSIDHSIRNLHKLLQEHSSAYTSLDSADELFQKSLHDIAEKLDGLVADLKFKASDASLYQILLKLRNTISGKALRKEIIQKLKTIRPRLLLFSEEDRALKSVYSLTAAIAEDPPVALGNLARTAELSLTKLWDAVERDQPQRYETLILQANRKLQSKLQAGWKQSEISVSLKVVKHTLEIRIFESDSFYSSLTVRSPGLLQFLALFCFTDSLGRKRSPILLIDEVETHLHINAQVDLVRAFNSQCHLSKIVYTTHSPACLPPNFGHSIRALTPDLLNPRRSKISSSFWQNGPGFGPLLVLMGASLSIFVSPRSAIFTEGITDTLLLPILLSKSNKLDVLPFSVLPGLAGARVSEYNALDAEAGKVFYIVDGDKAGDKMVADLRRSAIPVERIEQLPVPAIENLLDPNNYLQGIQLLLLEMYPQFSGVPFPKLIDFPNESWPNIVDEWATSQNIRLPSKRAIACRLIEEDLVVPNDIGVKFLTEVYHRVLAQLG
jgi:predicted ATP-dependent endonuclease of OLD family